VLGGRGGDEDEEEAERNWRVYEDGGVAFRPVPGNALVWVNLLPDGTGDGRVVHAGLPIADGVKFGLNIWPRTFFGPDAESHSGR
jgi:prolyl 4-hydroxylase